jgi:DNA (cytosine-5)-methyltransferase 1|tara:strand:+ start:1136 stop:1999 length:864 start_codon:yes stop_codon:yes gene_type:complete
MLQTVDLFSGIGGFSRGLEATGFFKTTRFVENDPYCQAVLRYHWPDIPVLGDIKSARRPDFPERTDLVCGGFPCQPFSQAGKQQAQDDPRHLWPEMFRIIRELRPTWVCGENVTGLVRLGLDEVLTDLEGEGYATRTFNIPACATGAPHLRQRLWIIAHANSESEPDGAFDGNARQRQLGFGFVADPKSNFKDGLSRKPDKEPDRRHTRLEPKCGSNGQSGRRPGPTLADPKCTGLKQDHWSFEPEVGRLVNGLPNRVPQLRALGNSIIPQIAERIGYAIASTLKGE